MPAAHPQPLAVVPLLLTLILAGWSAPGGGGPGPIALKPPGTGLLQEQAASSAKAGAELDFSLPGTFDRFVRPVLSDSCFQCHGPDAATRAADLRLDQPEGIQANRELLRERLLEADPAERMPPPEAHRQLSELERSRLVAWLDAGAPWAEHWAFVPPERPDVPQLPAGFGPLANTTQHGATSSAGLATVSGHGAETTAWSRNPIDAFIGARLAAQGLNPATTAEGPALLRRLFLALTGLPPTPEEQANFAAEAAELGNHAALDAWTERLTRDEPYLSRYAEQRARPWLDQARYADTAGIHMDAGWQAWAWRDWVLNAYRENLPFDEFGRLQLAGDLLPNPSQEQRVASGLHRLHVTTDEGGAIDEEYLVEYAVDRVATTGSVFLGLTLGCARCHDHKYDPISMEDFYGLLACFNSIEQPGLYSQIPDPTRAFEPFVVLETPADQAQAEQFAAERSALEASRDEETPEEQAEWQRFSAEMAQAFTWQPVTELRGHSAGGATLEPQADGSVLVSGERPAHDVLTIEFETPEGPLDTLLLEVLPQDGAGGSGPIGRADNGNAVLRELEVEAFSILDPSQHQRVELAWIGADHEQQNGDFAALNAIDGRESWWALEGHQKAGGRWALVRFGSEVGYPGGTRWKVTLDQRSQWAHHGFVRPRLSIGHGAAGSDALLPLALGRMHLASGFRFGATNEAYERAFPPEQATNIVAGQEAPKKPEDPSAGSWSWVFDERYVEGAGFDLPSTGREVLYIGREMVVPSARRIALELGSDDGVQLLLAGQKLFENQTERGLTVGSDRAEVELPAGRHVLLHKVINTGGQAGFSQRLIGLAPAQPMALLALCFPEAARADQGAALRELWRTERSPRYRQLSADLAALAEREKQFEAGRPKAMVMQERAMPRPTFVLTRGDYRHPDPARPVERAVPAVLGQWPTEAPKDRLGLAQWLFSRDNPLTARVQVNRLWAEFFGRGLVATGDDFGLQGERPSHPELLDWLAVEFIESGWDVQHMIKLITGSATYRQSSAFRPELAEIDPEDRLLARYPRRRLSAEELRDGALYASGLLVERFGGPSVKPYQPEGLWEEVAMLQSNTRSYQRGDGEALWRRSLYTYWKRASPPPAMLTFDAPTREFCVTERGLTDTPLQALVLQNDEQFREAARALAERTLLELDAGYAPAPEMPAELVRRGLEQLWRRVLGRAPEPAESAALATALADFRARFRADPEKAEALIAAGEAPRDPRLDSAELAAWAFVASSAFNLFEASNPR